MSELKAGFGVQERTEEIEPIDENEIIDIDAIDLEDDDRWLCDFNQCSSESRVHDLYAWLKSDSVLEPQEHPNSLKKCIDTRTFTRAKRKSNRLSFDSIMETLSSPIRNSLERQELPGQFQMGEDTMSSSQEIPVMLRPKISGLLGESQPNSMNQESLEAFINLSQSKGIDSFINLTEPEFADCLMNESQPSLLYSSITSIPADETKKNDSLCELDSGILTESMMQASMFQETQDINSFTEILLQGEKSPESNLTHTLDQTKVPLSPFDQTAGYVSPFERTFVNEEHSQEDLGENSVMPAQYETFQKSRKASPILHSNGSCTFTDSPLQNDFSHLQFDTSTPEEGRISINETFESLNGVVINENSIENAIIDADMTFNVKRLSSQANVLKFSLPDSQISNLSRNINNNNKQVNPSCLRQELLKEVEKNSRKLDSTFLHENNERKDMNMTYENSTETFAAPLDYYKTFTKEVSKKITQSQVDKRQEVVDEMEDRRFQTFRKPSKRENKECIDTTFLKNKDVENVNATFSKNNSVENVNTTFLKNEEHKSEGDNVNTTFCKPQQDKVVIQRQQNVNSTFSKPQARKLVAPKNLSKLPQFLQKSNPSIPTSTALRTLRAPGNFGFAKLAGSQPNIPRNVDKIHTLGKYKNESEQRLLGAIRNSSERIGNTGGSTESIESTQSAPDLDDRLSVCSDSSRSSYTISTTTMTIMRQSDLINAKGVHSLMLHGFKPESTPKPNRQILQNTWVQAERDLPSPILKNHTECPKSNNVSPPNNLKSSSPLFSPSSSNENINSLDGVKSNTQEIKLPKYNEKSASKAPNVQAPVNRTKSPADTKLKLKLPSNYNALRPASVASGIQRPASRIPAPKFLRPTSRIHEQKKG